MDVFPQNQLSNRSHLYSPPDLLRMNIRYILGETSQKFHKNSRQIIGQTSIERWETINKIHELKRLFYWISDFSGHVFTYIMAGPQGDILAEDITDIQVIWFLTMFMKIIYINNLLFIFYLVYNFIYSKVTCIPN